MVTEKKVGDEIENFIEVESWVEATELIEQALTKDKDSHWLLARLALCYYERRDYAKAEELALDALEIQPECPLALWEYAGALDMLGEEEEAIAIWTELVEMGAEELSKHPCGESFDWSQSLIDSCKYRLMKSNLDLGRQEEADKWRAEMRTVEDICKSLHESFKHKPWYVAFGVADKHIVCYTTRELSTQELAGVQAGSYEYEVRVAVSGHFKPCVK